MSERLRELHRQREAARTLLAWLEQEISRETDPTPLPSPPINQAEIKPDSDADLLIEQYADEERLDPAAARRGCLLAGLIAFASFAAVVQAIYFLFYRGR